MDLRVNFKAGGSFVRLPSQFSSNGENLYVAWENQILGYTTKTGALFARFQGIKSRIVGFGVHYTESYECVSACSESGEIITWKVATFFKLLNKKLDQGRIRSFHVVPNDGGSKALISFVHNKKILLDIIDLGSLKRDRAPFQIYDANFSLDVCGDRFFAVCQKNCLNIVTFRDFGRAYSYYIDPPREFTCLACHPEKDLILTGDNTGRCLLWQNLFTSKPAKAVYHWHTLPVRCLGFSTSGSYFYSGGNEAVLVKWDLDNNYDKKFLPRLPSTVSQISVSPNNIFIAISTDDNAIKIVDTKFDDVSLIQHLVIGEHLHTGIVIDPKTKALVMNGNVGHIQFYSTNNNTLLYNVDVVGQNRITNERNCNIENTQVTKMAISKNGSWMATVEYRKDPEYSSELRLKFWNFNQKIQNFKLNTSIEDPHDNYINSIAFAPVDGADDLKLISVGGDKKFRVWYLTEIETVENISEIWKCLCVGFYHNLPCRDLSFSIDGSLVAVTFDNIITTWIPDSCELKCALSHPVCKTEISQVVFGQSNQCHLLVAASKDRLCVWNLLTLTMLWTVPIEISILISDSVTTNMAVITNNNTIYVFTPDSPEPIFASDKLLKKQDRIYTASFVPSKLSNDVRMSWYQRSPIYFINSKMELFSIGSKESLETSNDIHEISDSLFSMTIPQNQVKSRISEPVQHLYQKDLNQKSLKKYLEAPIQTMVPIRIMCGGLLKSMVLQKN